MSSTETTPAQSGTAAQAAEAQAAPAISQTPSAAPAPEGWQPEIIAFCCNYCAYAAADLAGSRRMQYPTNIRIIHLPCTGKLEMEHILDAFLKASTVSLLPAAWREVATSWRAILGHASAQTTSARCWAR